MSVFGPVMQRRQCLQPGAKLPFACTDFEGGEGYPKKGHPVLREPKAVMALPGSGLRANRERVQVRRRTARYFPRRPAVSGAECQPPWPAGLPQPPGQPQAAHGHGCSGAHQGAVAPEPRQLRAAQDDRRVERGWCRRGAPACRATDARERDRR